MRQYVETVIVSLYPAVSWSKVVLEENGEFIEGRLVKGCQEEECMEGGLDERVPDQ